MAIVPEERKSVAAGFTGDRTSLAEWRRELKAAVRSLPQLLAAVDLPANIAAAENDFPIFVPRPFLARIRRGDPADPLLLQVLPRAEETVVRPGFATDAVGDLAAVRSPGLIHKYRGRALLITTGACAVHCRYCFRRHYPYSDSPRSVADWEPALEILRDDPSIEEVLLSGGDPWTIVDDTLAELARRLAEIPHLRRLRIHTRLPVMIPSRVDSELLRWLCGTRLTPLVVVHVNHAQEIDAAVAASLARLIDAGVPVLNQAVLLRGVNDSVDALVALSKSLIDLRVMPYYLHQLDRVQGAAHFEVPIERGQVLVDKMRRELPGYAVPRYVQESPGELFKRGL